MKTLVLFGIASLLAIGPVFAQTTITPELRAAAELCQQKYIQRDRHGNPMQGQYDPAFQTQCTALMAQVRSIEAASAAAQRDKDAATIDQATGATK